MQMEMEIFYTANYTIPESVANWCCQNLWKYNVQMQWPLQCDMHSPLHQRPPCPGIHFLWQSAPDSMSSDPDPPTKQFLLRCSTGCCFLRNENRSRPLMQMFP